MKPDPNEVAAETMSQTLRPVLSFRGAPSIARAGDQSMPMKCRAQQGSPLDNASLGCIVWSLMERFSLNAPV